MAKLNSSWIKRKINDVLEKTFAVSHVKTTYYNYSENKTLDDVLIETEDFNQEAVTEAEISPVILSKINSVATKESEDFTLLNANKAEAAEVYTKAEIDNKLLTPEEHSAASVTDENGTHGIRYKSGKIQVNNNGSWEDASALTDDALSETSENPVQNKVITTEINTLKKSVSDGKSIVANAITGQGVATATDATFATMAANIGTVGTNKYNAGKTDYNPTDATLGNDGVLTVKNSAGTTRLTKTFTNSYNKGVTDADARVLKTNASYKQGYIDGGNGEASKTINVTFTVYSAKGDNITIKNSSGVAVGNVVFSSGNVSKSVTLTIPSEGGLYTFVSSIAKNTTNGTSAYSKVVTLNSATKSVNVYPDGALYWYGNNISNFVLSNFNVNNNYGVYDSIRYDGDSAVESNLYTLNKTFENNYIYMKMSINETSKGIYALNSFCSYNFIELSEFDKLKAHFKSMTINKGSGEIRAELCLLNKNSNGIKIQESDVVKKIRVAKYVNSIELDISDISRGYVAFSQDCYAYNTSALSIEHFIDYILCE